MNLIQRSLKMLISPKYRKHFAASLIFLSIHCLMFSQAKIVMNGAKMNVVNSGYVVTNDISLTSTSSVNISSSTIKISGSIVNTAGNFDVTTGTVEMNGSSAQNIPVNAFATNKIKNLIISNDVTLGGQDSLTGVLSFGSNNKAFATSGFLTLKSTSAGTARVADLTNAGSASGNSITGNVKVERYVEARRAWRLLTAPVNANTQTINDAWQEGQTTTNNLPGFGTHITGGSIANGFDQGVNLNPSLKVYSAGAWVGLSNTNATSITNHSGYMIFIRGGRDVDISQGIYATPTSTVLRSIGQLKAYSQSYTIAPTGFTVIGNPYASPLNLYDVAKSISSNVQDNFYLWDPKITGTNGVGGYVNISWNGSSYDITPSSGGSGLNQYVSSGFAFLAKTIDGATAGTLVIKETDKATVQGLSARPAGNGSVSTLRTNLYAKNDDGTIPLVDGILNTFADTYSNSIDKYDAVKLKNISECLASQRQGQLLVAERRQPVTSADTIILYQLQMKVKSYRFEVLADNFNTNGLTAVLEDSYTNTSIPIDLQGRTTFDFNVINVAGSYYPKRFRIVFKQASVLPVTFTKARAIEENNNIKVEWQTENEAGIQQYEIEKSSDGQSFNKTKTVLVNQNKRSSSNFYNWLDESVYEGNNFYRIKSTSINGEIKYSAVMKVFMPKQNSEIVLETNVIINNEVILLIKNMPKGAYGLSIINNSGQVMYTKKIEHAGGSSTEKIQLNKNIIAGVYHVSIVKPDLSSLTMKLLVR